MVTTHAGQPVSKWAHRSVTHGHPPPLVDPVTMVNRYDCLEAATMAHAGWVVCKVTGITYHVHGERLHAHDMTTACSL